MQSISRALISQKRSSGSSREAPGPTPGVPAVAALPDRGSALAFDKMDIDKKNNKRDRGEDDTTYGNGEVDIKVTEGPSWLPDSDDEDLHNQKKLSAK